MKENFRSFGTLKSPLSDSQSVSRRTYETLNDLPRCKATQVPRYKGRNHRRGDNIRQDLTADFEPVRFAKMLIGQDCCKLQNLIKVSILPSRFCVVEDKVQEGLLLHRCSEPVLHMAMSSKIRYRQSGRNLCAQHCVASNPTSLHGSRSGRPYPFAFPVT